MSIVCSVADLPKGIIKARCAISHDLNPIRTLRFVQSMSVLRWEWYCYHCPVFIYPGHSTRQLWLLLPLLFVISATDYFRLLMHCAPSVYYFPCKLPMYSLDAEIRFISNHVGRCRKWVYHVWWKSPASSCTSGVPVCHVSSMLVLRYFFSWHFLLGYIQLAVVDIEVIEWHLFSAYLSVSIYLCIWNTVLSIYLFPSTRALHLYMVCLRVSFLHLPFHC